MKSGFTIKSAGRRSVGEWLQKSIGSSANAFSHGFENDFRDTYCIWYTVKIHSISSCWPTIRSTNLANCTLLSFLHNLITIINIFAPYIKFLQKVEVEPSISLQIKWLGFAPLSKSSCYVKSCFAALHSSFVLYVPNRLLFQKSMDHFLRVFSHITMVSLSFLFRLFKKPINIFFLVTLPKVQTFFSGCLICALYLIMFKISSFSSFPLNISFMSSGELLSCSWNCYSRALSVKKCIDH